jgi:hypothetical protein
MTVTWDPSHIGSGVAMSNGNLTATQTGGDNSRSMLATGGYKTSGKFYFRASCGPGDNYILQLGIATSALNVNSYIGVDANSICGDPNISHGSPSDFSGGHPVSFDAVATAGDYIVIAVDLDLGKFWATVQTAGGVLSTNWNGTSGSPAAGSGGYSGVAGDTSVIIAGGVYQNTGTITLDAASAISDATLVGFRPWDSVAGTLSQTIDPITAQAAGNVVPAPAGSASGSSLWWWPAYVRRHEAEREAARLKWLVDNSTEGDGQAALPMPVARGELIHNPDPDEADLAALAAAALWLLAA